MPKNLTADSDLRRNKRAVRTIERLLRRKYGSPRKERLADPLDVLIQTVLSQNTTDTNSHRAYQKLRQRFDGWESVRRAPAARIEEAIRSGGLANVKARRIKRILSKVKQLSGDLSLRILCELPPEDAERILRGFPGVGPKTINCVLLFGCEMDVFPVDTHILRVSKRIGLIPEKTSLERAHALWRGLFPRGLAYSLHLNLINHGRKTCRPRNPHCLDCCLRDLCRHYLTIRAFP